MKQYFIVTPAKNEEKNLPNLIQSMIVQTFKPILWVIVNDGSTDNTFNIIEEAKRKYPWIQNIELENHPRDIHKRYAYVCNTGFNFAIEYCRVHDIQYGFIGIVDSDMVLEMDFFEKLIKEFEKNPKLGIASGGEYYYDSNNKLVLEEVSDETPVGCMRLWKKECFDDIGMYPISYSPDSVSNVMAELKGWNVKMFKNIKGIQARKTGSAEGMWNGYKIKGMSDYFRNYSFFFAFAKGFGFLFKRPFYIGIAYLYGYINSILKKMDRINNEEVKQYYRNKHNQVLQRYWIRLKTKINI